MNERAVKILYTSISYDHAVVKIGGKEFVLDATRGLWTRHIINSAHLLLYVLIFTIKVANQNSNS